MQVVDAADTRAIFHSPTVNADLVTYSEKNCSALYLTMTYPAPLTPPPLLLPTRAVWGASRALRR